MSPEQKPLGSIQGFLACDDPLCSEAIEYLVNGNEENHYVDYKQAFDPSNPKQWLDITIDAMAFANTYGGYLVFGVEDRTFRKVGLCDEAVKALADASEVAKKLNRYVAPAFTGIRAKPVEVDSVQLVVLCFPESKRHTHIVVKPGSYRLPSNEERVVLWPGAIYARRSGSNQILAPEDLELIIARRIEHFQTSLFQKIAKVVKAPPEHQVLVFDPSSATSDAKGVLISNAPDAIPVKGISFSIAPETDEQEIASWLALSGRDKAFLPSPGEVWRLYASRRKLHLSPEQSAGMARICLLSEVPCFFWLQLMQGQTIRTILEEALKVATGVNQKSAILKVAGFLGRRYHGKCAKRLRASLHQLSSASRFPSEGPRSFFAPEDITELRRKMGRKVDESALRAQLEERIDGLALALAENKGHGVMEKRQAFTIDCYLYGRDDRYAGTPSQTGNEVARPPDAEARNVEGLAPKEARDEAD